MCETGTILSTYSYISLGDTALKSSADLRIETLKESGFYIETKDNTIFPHLPGRLLIESAMICFICPTACAAAVVCAKLGGSAAHLTSYILLINIAAALFIPLIVPLVNPHEGQTFLATFLLVLRRVFPTLICPLLLAWLIRYTMPHLARRLQNTGDAAFYLWTVALTMAIAVTTRSIVHSNVPVATLLGIALVTLVCCWAQFTIGRRIGRSSGDHIAAGQAIGQKNTVFAICIPAYMRSFDPRS